MVACSYPSRYIYILRYFTGEISGLKTLKNKKKNGSISKVVGELKM